MRRRMCQAASEAENKQCGVTSLLSLVSLVTQTRIALRIFQTEIPDEQGLPLTKVRPTGFIMSLQCRSYSHLPFTSIPSPRGEWGTGSS